MDLFMNWAQRIHVFQWACSPACTELEAVVMDWTAKLLGLSDHFLNSSGVGGGVLQVGDDTGDSFQAYDRHSDLRFPDDRF